jgi:glyceraldehyde-3-phosphate dehydrogenase/erythrose-4-phosphate dehydrogenase
MDLAGLAAWLSRAGLAEPEIEFIAINDLVPPDNLAYLPKI